MLAVSLLGVTPCEIGVKNSVFDARLTRLFVLRAIFLHALHAMHAWFQYDGFMAMITIRNLDAEVKRGLQVRAAMNGRSMEAEARAILAVIVRYVPVAEMPGPEPGAPEKE